MAETKLFNSIGLCRRAGKCQSGEFAAERAVKAGKAKLILLEQTASENTRARFTSLCAGRKRYRLPSSPRWGGPSARKARWCWR